jgi:phage shock protein A
MGILQRAADIFAANLHDAVDRFEDPERMLRHAVREIEELVDTTTAAVARSIATEKLLVKQQREHAAEADVWQRRAGEAIAAGDEALARRAVKRRLDCESAAASLDRQIADARAANATLRRQLELLREKHAAVRSKLTLLCAQRTAADAQRLVLAKTRSAHGNVKALARFERFGERVQFAQAEAEALLELETGGDAEIELRFRQEADERAIDDEIERLKAARQGP